MRTHTPPLAPGKLTHNVTVHIVLNDFGEQLGRAYVETDEAETDEWTVVSKIIDGEYFNPVRVVAFNIAEGWSRDVTEDIAQAVIERERSENRFSKFAKEFVAKTLGASTKSCNERLFSSFATIPAIWCPCRARNAPGVAERFALDFTEWFLRPNVANFFGTAFPAGCLNFHNN